MRLDEALDSSGLDPDRSTDFHNVDLASLNQLAHHSRCAVEDRSGSLIVEERLQPWRRLGGRACHMVHCGSTVYDSGWI